MMISGFDALSARRDLTWIRRTPPPCPEYAKGLLVDPGGGAAGARCMVEADAGPNGLVLEEGCGYRPAAGGLALD